MHTDPCWLASTPTTSSGTPAHAARAEPWHPGTPVPLALAPNSPRSPATSPAHGLVLGMLAAPLPGISDEVWWWRLLRSPSGE